MYYVNSNYLNKGKMLDKTELMDIDGFLLSSKRKVYRIDDCDIKEIKVVNKNLAKSLASKKVNDKYQKLIEYLTSILVDDDDDSGDSYREALNQIEKFRLIVKNKYRNFLTKKELELMSKQLVILQRELNKRLIEIHNSYMDMFDKTSGKGR